MVFNKENRNKRWQEAEELELTQIDQYDSFKDLGKGAKPPHGHKHITIHMVYNVKHDGCHKARLVAGGHLTGPPLESMYSGVVLLRSLRIVIFLAKLNDLKLWGADIGNVYCETHTSEKVYIIAGPEFGKKEGHTLIINKALYRLKSLGARWHKRLFDVLFKMGWKPCKADQDVWMKENDGLWENIAVYMDDLCIALKSPEKSPKL